MVDRIDKIDRNDDYWKIAESAESQKDRQQGNQEEKEEKKDAFASFGEKTDWQLLFDKSRLWKRNIQVSDDEIEKIIFRKINLKTDPSLLRVDVELKGGEIITPSFVSISRETGLRLKSLNSGDAIPLQHVLKDNILRLTIPANPKLFLEEENRNKQPAKEIPIEPEEENTEDITVTSIVKTPESLDWKRPEMFFVYAVILVVLMLFLIIMLVL